ncbi:MAG TPA: ATP-binding protein [Candidatus Saccharimonadales bacterium]|nr:ATP-binding protein [Candidatus Saccharimonadales bacterium]
MPDNRTIAGNSGLLEHQRLISLINSMADAVIAIDENIKIVIYNAAALNILDVNATIQNEPLDKSLKIFDKDNKPVDINLMISNTKIPTANRDYLLHYNDGSIINLYLSVAPVHQGYGQSGQRGYVLVLRDITKEKSLEEERDEFISVVSHELRTPIAIVEGNVSNAEVIADQSGSISDIKEALHSSHEQIIFLSQLINDLATLSRAERGRLTVEIGKFNAHKLIEELVDNYDEQAQKAGLTIHADINSSLELLTSSELYVKEILQNFMTNALKYTQKGSVTISAHPKANGIEFAVSDTGIGISKSDQEKVFHKFFRSEDYRTRETNGTGLGLYVTKKLANLLNADISVKSELNKGSTFSIFIPNLKQK